MSGLIAAIRRPKLTPHQVALTRRHFRYDTSINSGTAECIRCGITRAINISRQYEHVITSCTTPNIAIADELRQGRSSNTTSTSISQAIHRKRLTEKCYKAIFYGGKPLNHFDKAHNPFQYDLLSDLARSANLSDWTPPSRYSVVSQLTNFYEKRYEMAQQQIKPQSYIGFTADESADAANRRVLNVSAISPHFGPVFICNLDMEDTRSTSENLAEMVRDIILQWVDDPKSIAWIATDTCATALKCQKLIASDPRFAHVLLIPCDSHGLQLLLKDVLECSGIMEIARDVHKVSSFLKNAHLQFARLRRHQLELNNGKTRAITLAVIARWGSHYGEFESLNSMQNAVKAWMHDPHVIAQLQTPNSIEKDLKAIMHILRQPTFWPNLEFMLEILKPIHIQQKKSESNSHHLGLVLKGWSRIKNVWTRLPQRYPEHPDINAITDSIVKCWEKRCIKQTTDIHQLAYLLNPSIYIEEDSQAAPIRFSVIEAQHNDAETALRRHLRGSEEDVQKALDILDLMRLKNGSLHRNAEVWKHAKHPLRFWNSPIMIRHHKQLSQLAVRMFSTTANTCPSERSFAAMRWVQGCRRGRLTGSRSDMLVFLFHNARFLQQIENDDTSTEDTLPNSWYTISDEDKEILDEEFFNDWMRMRASAEIMSTTVPTTIVPSIVLYEDNTQGNTTAEMIAMARDVLNQTQESYVEL